MGGEPTFVSIDDFEAGEWNTDAVGPTKRGLADQLIRRLRDRFAPGGFLHYGQGKWYPGETLPRWTFSLYWRRDGKPIWSDPDLIAEETAATKAGPAEAETLLQTMAAELGVEAEMVTAAYEDPAEWIVKEGNLPENVTPENSKLKDPEERHRIARVFERGLTKPSGYVLPIQRWQAQGLRPALALRALEAAARASVPRARRQPGRLPPAARHAAPRPALAIPLYQHRRPDRAARPAARPGRGARGVQERSTSPRPPRADTVQQDRVEQELGDLSGAVRTALSVEPRDGRLCVFMPPVERVEDYLELVAAAEAAAKAIGLPVHIEGYGPPTDPRLNVIRVAPDPGVIEVNVHPATSWEDCVATTTGVYEEARQCRLGADKFMIDGRHTGTGGGNHVVVGGGTTLDSPFLRRPDLLRS